MIILNFDIDFYINIIKNGIVPLVLVGQCSNSFLGSDHGKLLATTAQYRHLWMVLCRCGPAIEDWALVIVLQGARNSPPDPTEILPRISTTPVIVLPP